MKQRLNITQQSIFSDKDTTFKVKAVQEKKTYFCTNKLVLRFSLKKITTVFGVLEENKRKSYPRKILKRKFTDL